MLRSILVLIREGNTKLIEIIFLHSFWSFLFILSGIANLILGIVSLFTGWLAVKDFVLPTYAICFIGGIIYFAIGVGIAFMVKRKGKFE